MSNMLMCFAIAALFGSLCAAGHLLSDTDKKADTNALSYTDIIKQEIFIQKLAGKILQTRR